jgi:16S rRNA (guanine966-N2)-methyltransferase
VIAGTAGGRLLVVPKRSIRPTTDRVKESLFAALGTRVIRDVAVLDLYAGSGALAIEALSRGAAHAVLVERDADCADAIRRNLEATGLTERARVHRGAVEGFLRRGAPPEAPFDLAFLDPPYDMPASALAAALEELAAPGWLGAAAAVVLERASTGDRPRLPGSWTTAWERAYGDTLVTVATAEM